MINLFEYQNKIQISEEFGDKLEIFLNEIWKNRDKNASFYQNNQKKDEIQRFVNFFRKPNKIQEIKSKKYVGVIYFENKRINLLPKIFYDKTKDYSENEIAQIQNHILWWLSYCRKIKFPKYSTQLGNKKNDFFEVLIYLFAKYTRELLNNSIFRQYEEINEELEFIKGRLNISRYISENLSKARWHKLNCSFDSFVFDNKFNRIIKYVAKMLKNVTSSKENKKRLNEILFILDEVSDEKATAQQCAKISFNPMFEEFATVRDYCQLFLSNTISFDYKNNLKLFAFLLPMEYVFEDFIFGFIKKEIKSINVTSQAGNIFLDEEKNFKLKPDLLIEFNNKKIIADTKYKIVYSDKNDSKNSVSQADLYQMLAYATRFNSKEIILFYPNTVNENLKNETEITIKDCLANGEKILIKIVQLPILDKNVLNQELDLKTDLKILFNLVKQNLIQTIKKSLFVEGFPKI